MTRLGLRRPALLAAALTGALAVTTLPASAVYAPGTQRSDTLFPGQGNSGYDVRHYDVRLTWTPVTGSVRAAVGITARATARLDSFHLDYEGPALTGVAVDGVRAKAVRRGSELIVSPARPIADGRSFRVTVGYSGKPPTHTDPDDSTEGWVPTADGATALGEPVGTMAWLPSNNTPADKASYRYVITTPIGYRATANGDLVSERTSGGSTTATWNAPEPMATYLAMVTIGRFTVTRSTFTSTDGRRIPLRTYVQTGASAGATGRLAEVLKAEERWFGPYPFSAGGSLVDDASVGYALETQTRPFYPVGDADISTVVHESAHQWFGDSVTLRDWHDIWLAEGFATYAEWLWSASHGGKSTASRFDDLYQRPASDALWSPAPRRFTDPADLFGSPVYNRGAMTLQALRERIGDRDFFRFVRRWAADRRHGSATTAQLVSLAESTSGRELSGFFRTWLDTDGKPSGY